MLENASKEMIENGGGPIYRYRDERERKETRREI